MPLISWSTDFSVGVQELDNHHMQIIDSMNALYDASSRRGSHTLVAETIEKLIASAMIHFSVEETLMRLCHYPGYEPHKASHDRLLSQLNIYREKFIKGDNKITIQMIIFLKNWLFDHILHEDKAYTVLFLDIGANKSLAARFRRIFSSK